MRAAALIPAVSPLSAAQPANPGVHYRDYSRCLPDYLRTLAAEARALRERETATLATPERIRARQKWVRDTFWRLVGGQPERTPLNARTLGEVKRDGYTIQNVLYESRPNLHIPANLYIPSSGRSPYPGVLFQMGHTLNGKAGDTYQKCCQGLARLGYLVLAFDPMGQGERTYYPRPGGTLTRLRSADEEHNLPGRQMLLVGDTSTRFQAWDAVRSLDYLAGHPLVDPTRLASTGQSGGGTLTMLLACIDDRLACAAVASGNTENVAAAGFNPPGSSDDAEQDFINSGTAGFDRWDLLYPIAPKPLLVLVSSKDSFGTYSSNYIKDGWSEYLKLQQVYEVLGAKEKLGWGDTPLPHGLAYGPRLDIYRWFEKWLKPAGTVREIAEEPPVKPEPDEQTWVSPGGNVVRAFHGQTPFSLLKRPRNPKGGQWRQVLGVTAPPVGVHFAELGRTPFPRVQVTAVEVQSAPQVWLPAWLYEPRPTRSGLQAVLVLEANGRNGQWQEDGPWPRRAVDGEAVCVADVRGTGDLLPEFPRGSARYARTHQEEEHYAWASLILGRPLVGQRTMDILTLILALANRTGGKVRVEADGKLTIPTLFAAAMSPEQVESVRLTGGLISYASILETEEYKHPTANFAFNLLNEVDLPEVAASIAPRRITLIGTVDAAGQPVSAGAVRRVYRSANIEVI